MADVKSLVSYWLVQAVFFISLVVMIKFLSLFIACALPLSADDWEPLIDSELSKWTVWTGVPHSSVDVEWDGKSDDVTKGGKPMGEGDPLKIYQVVKGPDGDLQLYITGQVYAGLTTKKDYKNYHLSMEVKWGEKKYAPRFSAPRDSGILYHCQGEHGQFWNVWKQSLECQVQENDNGDYFQICNVGCDIPVVYLEEGKRPRFDPNGEWKKINGSVQRSKNVEKAGEWNKVEVYTLGDRALHVSNGELVLALKNATQTVKGETTSLEEGQIQIQSEGAEVTYRNFKMREITDFPAEFKDVFKD